MLPSFFSSLFLASPDTTISGAKASGGVSSEGHPTPNSITEDSNESMQVGGAGRDVSREMSVESTTSNRSGVEESETGWDTFTHTEHCSCVCDQYS